MENLIRLAEAMGFWGWCSLTSMTGIICLTFYQLKKLQLRADGMLGSSRHEQQESENADGKSTSWPQAFSEAVMWLSLPLMFLAIAFMNS